MAKKVYTIKVLGGYIKLYLRELTGWGVKPSQYQVSGDTVTTQNLNVVDVATETFMYHPELIEITTS